MLDPPIVLADEPTANLDSKTGKRIIELLVGLRSEDRSVLIATRDADIAANADAILEVSDRRDREHARRLGRERACASALALWSSW